MAGYSGTPLLQKLGIKEGNRVLVCNPPDTLPEELSAFLQTRSKKDLDKDLDQDIDVVLLFAVSSNAFQKDFLPLTRSLKTDGMIWVAWPKKAAKIKTDLTENEIRNRALKTPFVDVKVCAIDETWSGLKLVIRKKLRAASNQKAVPAASRPKEK